MNEEDERVDPSLLKGYNDGYLIAKHKPELVKELSEKVRVVKKNSLSNYSTGFDAGVREAQKELFKENFKSKGKERGR